MILPLAAFVLQNPNDPKVDLPLGWRVDYFKETDGRQGALVGPQGERIVFPAYGGGPTAAAELRRQEPKALYDAAFLGGRRVEAILQADGTLTVTLGGRSTDGVPIARPMTYRTHVDTARQAAQALLIVLTRSDHEDRELARRTPPLRVAPVDAPPATVPGLPAGARVNLPDGYAYRTNDRIRPVAHWFTSPNGPTILLAMGLDPARAADPHAPNVGTAWIVQGDVFGKTLSVRGNAEGGLAFRYAPPEAVPKIGRVPILATEEATPRAALIAVFATLTYRPAS